MRMVDAVVKYGLERGSFLAKKQRITTVKAAVKPQAKPQVQPTEARPTITLERVMSNGPDTSSFGGWGPKVTGLGSMLKNWN